MDQGPAPLVIHSRADRYPRELGVDFRKLSSEALRTYVNRYRLEVATDTSDAELAATAARHFDSIPVDEEAIMARFFEHLDDLDAEGSSDAHGAARVREQARARRGTPSDVEKREKKFEPADPTIDFETCRGRRCDVDMPRRRVAVPPRLRRGYAAEARRGDAAAATWIFRGDGSRRRRGCDVDIPWRRV